MSNPFKDALENIFGKQGAGTRSSNSAVAGITRTRIVNGPARLHRCWVSADTITNAASTVAFWSLDDSNVSASGSAGNAVIGDFVNNTSGTGHEFVQTFVPPIQFDNGLTFNYTATGTGTGLKYSFWFS